MSKEKQGWRHDQDQPLESSPNEFKSFLKSSIWRDMEMTISDRIDILTNTLIAEDDLDRLRSLQSEIRTLRDMLGLPEYLIYRIELESGGTHAED